MDQLFEYDSSKSLSNEKKHGIQFETAKKVWDDRNALVAKSKNIIDEDRWIIVGKINDKIWSIIFMIRRNKIRIISARRARKEEVKQYEKNKRK